MSLLPSFTLRSLAFAWPAAAVIFAWPATAAIFAWPATAAIFAWPAAAAIFAWPAAAATISFHVSDQTDPVEVAEATTVFVNGRLVAHFELSADHPFADVAVSVPVADRYEYALCGRITIRAADGHSETHVLDDGASMPDPNGRHLEALAADGFTTFFLAERTGEQASTPTDLHKTNVCAIPTS